MNSGELLNQLLIDLQSLFRTSFRKKKFTLSQINLISSIPINGIEMTSISIYLGIDNSTLTRNVNVLINQNILINLVFLNGCFVYILNTIWFFMILKLSLKIFFISNKEIKEALD